MFERNMTRQMLDQNLNQVLIESPCLEVYFKTQIENTLKQAFLGSIHLPVQSEEMYLNK